MTDELYDEVMEDSAEHLAALVVGKKIVSAEARKWTLRNRDDSDYFPWYHEGTGLVLTLNDGTEFAFLGKADCCAYTDLENFIMHPDKVDNIITGVKTEDDYQKWHIMADAGDVMELSVGWSEGSGYYAYGFEFPVVEVS